MSHPLARLDLLEPELGLEPDERRAVSRAARDRAGMSDAQRRRLHPGGLEPPRRRRVLETLVAVVPWCLGSATIVALALGGWRPRLLAVVFAAELLVIVAFTAWASAAAFLPWRWAILRERGRDLCLHCGAQAGGDARTPTRCAECGATSPAALAASGDA